MKEEIAQSIQDLRAQFIERMDDDFNTADAIAVLFELTRIVNTYMAGQVYSKAELEAFLQLYTELTEVLGIELEAENRLLDEEIEALITARNQARIDRDFKRADDIRDTLKAKGIILEDTPQGVRWRRES